MGALVGIGCLEVVHDVVGLALVIILNDEAIVLRGRPAIHAGVSAWNEIATQGFLGAFRSALPGLSAVRQQLTSQQPQRPATSPAYAPALQAQLARRETRNACHASTAVQFCSFGKEFLNFIQCSQ